MSTIKTNAVQIGQSVTATNNFTFYQPTTPDGSVRLGNGNAGAATDKVTIQSSGDVGVTGGITAGNGITAVDGTGLIQAGTLQSFGDIESVSQNGGQLAGLRNNIINGNMNIAQRGTTAVTVNGNYGPPDRWANASGGDTFSTTQESFVSGDTLYDTGGAQYFLQVGVTSVANIANYMALFQKMEDVRVLAGQTVTVSFWAKCVGTGLNIGVSFTQFFGTGGSTTIDGAGQAQTLTTSWAKYSKTFTIPSVNGKTIGPANTSFTQLIFWLDAGSNYNTQSGSIGQASKTVSIAQVQIEVGTVATPFEQRPIGMELALCQRYFEVIQFIATATSPPYTTIRYVVTKRAVPSQLTITGGAITPAVLNARTSSYFSIDGTATTSIATSATANSEL